MQPTKCPEQSCNTTNTITLALPLLLSLDTHSEQLVANMQLYNTASDACGLVQLGWYDTTNTLQLRGATCGGAQFITHIHHNPPSSAWWIHIEVAMKQVRLCYLGYENIATTFNCQADLPSQVMVVLYGLKYSYSALPAKTKSQNHQQR